MELKKHRKLILTHIPSQTIQYIFTFSHYFSCAFWNREHSHRTLIGKAKQFSPHLENKFRESFNFPPILNLQKSRTVDQNTHRLHQTILQQFFFYNQYPHTTVEYNDILVLTTVGQSQVSSIGTFQLVWELSNLFVTCTLSSPHLPQTTATMKTFCQSMEFYWNKLIQNQYRPSNEPKQAETDSSIVK